MLLNKVGGSVASRRPCVAVQASGVRVQRRSVASPVALPSGASGFLNSAGLKLRVAVQQTKQSRSLTTSSRAHKK